MQADPVNLNLKSFEYRVITGRENRDIYSVEKVTGIEKKTGNQKNYTKFSESSNASKVSYKLQIENEGDNEVDQKTRIDFELL